MSPKIWLVVDREGNLFTKDFVPGRRSRNEPLRNFTSKNVGRDLDDLSLSPTSESLHTQFFVSPLISNSY